MRKVWPDSNQLAQELYALLVKDDLPLEHDGPITIRNKRGGPALIIQSDGDGSIPIQMQGPNGSPVGNIEFKNGLPTFTVPSHDGNGNAPAPNSVGATGGGGGSTNKAFACRVVSGSGSTYTCDVYENGLNSAPVTHTVTQLAIDPAGQVPRGSWDICFKDADGNFYAQFPVWL